MSAITGDRITVRADEARVVVESTLRNARADEEKFVRVEFPLR